MFTGRQTDGQTKCDQKAHLSFQLSGANNSQNFEEYI